VSILALKIWVYGTLHCGTNDEPFGGFLNITIYGAKPPAALAQSDRVCGDKSVAILGGILMLHGKKLHSWTRLAVTASPGDSQITIFEEVRLRGVVLVG
jgi:hypothetical protein